AVDFSGSRDTRARELERRVVLSQYLTAVQLGGDVPPQESGLTCSTWYGKHHTEMMWWHTAHFALWGRPQRLAQQLRSAAQRGAAARAGPSGWRSSSTGTPSGCPRRGGSRRSAACAVRAGPRWSAPRDARAPVA